MLREGMPNAVDRQRHHVLTPEDVPGVAAARHRGDLAPARRKHESVSTRKGVSPEARICGRHVLPEANFLLALRAGRHIGEAEHPR